MHRNTSSLFFLFKTSSENMMKPEASVLCSHFTKCFRNSCNSSKPVLHTSTISNEDSKSATIPRKPGGWKATPYIIGNDTLERLAAFGLLANFMVYLTREMHLDQVSASNVIYIWSGLTNFASLLGAFISDAYVGRFRTIVFSSFSLLLGMVTLTMTAWLPELHPPPCNNSPQKQGKCIPPSKAQLGFLFLGLGFLSVGAGGIRPCSIPFGVDQFDPNTEEGKKGIKSFFTSQHRRKERNLNTEGGEAGVSGGGVAGDEGGDREGEKVMRGERKKK